MFTTEKDNKGKTVIIYWYEFDKDLFTNRSDFIDRIKTISPDNSDLPPEWVTGCFYSGEAQILLNKENIYNKFYTLAHETFHPLFSKFVYQKNGRDRIIWLYESLAGNFDGTTKNLIKQNEFSAMIEKLIGINDLPAMSQLSFDKGNIMTDKYNGYELFKVVGIYLVETKTDEELLSYIQQEKEVLIDGDIILEISLKYFKEKYDL